MRACGSRPPCAANGPVLAETYQQSASSGSTVTDQVWWRSRPSSAGRQVSPASVLKAAPPPPASYALPRARGCQASECTSGCAPGRWSCQLSPPSLERIRPPSSIPTRSSFASCGLGAIQRTCDVHGRGGKLQLGREGSSSSASSSRHDCPRSSLRNSRLGSVPAYTAPSALLTASEKTPGSGNAQSVQLRPASLVRRTPPSRSPAQTVCGSSGSTARHCAPLPGKDSSTVHPSAEGSSRAIPSPVAAYRRAITTAYAPVSRPRLTKLRRHASP